MCIRPLLLQIGYLVGAGIHGCYGNAYSNDISEGNFAFGTMLMGYIFTLKPVDASCIINTQLIHFADDREIGAGNVSAHGCHGDAHSNGTFLIILPF